MEKEIINKGKYLRVVRIGNWEYVERTTGKDVAYIIPAFKEKHLISLMNDVYLVFIKEWRIPVQKYVVGFPAPDACNDYVRKLHGRNVQILLGKNLDTPVEFVMCWTPGGKNVGGTGLGLRLAEREGITVYNFFKPKDLIKVHERFLNED